MGSRKNQARHSINTKTAKNGFALDTTYDTISDTTGKHLNSDKSGFADISCYLL